MPGHHDRLQAIPRVQSIALPRQQVFLSMERLHLGEVPLFARVHRIIVVSNRSTDDSVRFTWKMDGDFQRDTLNVSPMYGTVPPGCDCVCTVTFCSTTAPCLHNYDVRCEIESVAARLAYEEAVLKAAREARAAEDALEIVHGSPHTTRELKTVPQRVGSVATLPAVNQKLPPIGGGISEPKPSSVYLGIVARTHRQMKATPTQGSTVFLDKEALAERNQSVVGSDGDAASLTEANMNEIGQLIGHLLEDILHDDGFITSVKGIPNEPLPYYLQFVNNNNNIDDEVQAANSTEEPTDAMCQAEGECLIESILVNTLSNIMSELWHIK